MPDEKEVLYWVERFRQANPIKEFCSSIGSPGIRNFLVSLEGFRTRLFDGVDSTGAKREAYRRLYGREPDSVFFQPPIEEDRKPEIPPALSINPNNRGATGGGTTAPAKLVDAQLRDEVVKRVETHFTAEHPSRGEIKAERRVICDDYKAECEQHGVRVTDKMIAQAASPRWTSRTAIQKWLQCDPRYDGEADRLIRNVFIKKPHISPRP